jgi:hypothetical protein
MERRWPLKTLLIMEAITKFVRGAGGWSWR